MKSALYLLLLGGILLMPRSVEAIIFYTPIILIPIAKIVASIIGVFAAPSLGLGFIWHKLTSKSLIKITLLIILLWIIIGFLIGILLHLENPSRPIF